MAPPPPVALVTGAGVRVGKAVALALASDGFDVIVHGNRSMDGVRDTASQIHAMGRTAYVEQADLADDASVDALAQRLVAQHARIDVVVHSAGIFEEVSFGHVQREQFRRMQRINAEAPFFLTQGLLPALEQGALVVHILDVTAHRPVKKYAHYTMAKAALYGLTKALCVELGPTIRVCGIAPGIVAPFPEQFDAELRERIVKRIPLKRVGEPDDIGRAVVFLARSPYMNGVVLPVDGGWMVSA